MRYDIEKLKAFFLAFLLILLLTGCASSEAPMGDRTTITLACLVEQDVAQMVAAFHEAQDEIYVSIKSYYDESGSASYDASRERMYADLATGNEADLVYMLRLDEGALLNAGLLVDLMPFLEEDNMLNDMNYQTNIWRLFMRGDQLYHIAASFYLYGIEAPKEVIGDRYGWTLDEFQCFIAEHPDALYLEQSNMLDCMLRYGLQGDFVDLQARTCSFESQEFYTLLAFLGDCPQSTTGSGQRIGGYFQSIDCYSRSVKRDGISYRYAGFPSERKTGPVVMADDSFGIISCSKQQDACWAFIKWMLSYEIQERFYSDNPYEIPIHAGVLNETMRRAQLSSDQEDSLFYGEMDGVVKQDGKWVSVPFAGVSGEDVQYLQEVIRKADRAAFAYGDITAIVEEEILAYLAGDKTAEECAHLIQSRVSTLLAETQ